MQSMFYTLFMCFTLFGWLEGGRGGFPKGLGHNLLMQFSTLYSSKMEISTTTIFDFLTIHNDQISYVKHVLDTPNSGVWRGGEAAPKPRNG